MIEARGLTKRYGRRTAVDDLTFTVRPGIVTGFLGPNGAGKSTTMRMALGLDAPTRGSVTVNGKPYREHATPLHEVGALLEARSVHTGRSAYHPPAGARPDCGHCPHAGGGGDRARRAARRGPQAGGQLLPRDGPTPRHRHRTARRPAHPHPGRAGQRPGSRGHPLDPGPAQGPRRRGPHGIRLLAPDERDGAHRRTSDRHWTGAAHRRCQRDRVHRRRRPQRGAGTQHRAGAAACAAGRAGRRRLARGRWRTGGQWPDVRPDRSRGGPGRHLPARAHTAAGLTGGRVHGPHPRHRGVHVPTATGARSSQRATSGGQR